MGMNTGVSMGGSIEYTRSRKTKNFIRKKDNEKKKRAKVCLECDFNREGFCGKFKKWCTVVNYICSGEKDPYDNIYKKPKKKNVNKKKVKRKPKKKVNKKKV